jgi:hypothetical protein
VKNFWTKVNNNRVLILKIAGNVVALLVAMGYVSVESGQQINEAVVMGFALAQLVGGLVLGAAQRSQAYGPESVKELNRRYHGH